MPPLQQARLTLESGVAIPNVNRSGSLLYLTPYQGNRVSLYIPGIGWHQYELNECSLSFSGVASGKNADIFLRHNGTELVLEKILWTDDDTRSEELSLMDGVWLRATDFTWRYMGTVRTSAEGVLMDSETQRFVWNANQRVSRTLKKMVTPGSYSYSGGSRLWHGDSNNKIEMVCGLQAEAVWSTCCTTASTTGVLKIGMGINATSFAVCIRSQVNQVTPMVCPYCGQIPLGYVTINLLEAAGPGEASLYPENTFGIGSVNCVFSC